VLLGLALCSVPLIPKAKRITLKEDDGHEEAPAVALLHSVNKKSPSQLSEKPVEEDNGTLLQEDQFYHQMKRRKAAITILALSILSIHAVMLGLHIAYVAGNMAGLSKHSLLLSSDVCWLLYWALLSVLSLMATATRSRHWSLTIHLSAFTFLTLIAYLVPVIVPPTVFKLPGHSSTESKIWNVVLAVQCCLIFIISITMDSGPAIHHEPARLANVHFDIYAHFANVSPLARASVLSRMMFSWTTPLIRATSGKPQLDASDMPFLPAVWRSATQMYRFSMRPAGRRLIPHLLTVNRSVIAVQTLLAAANSILYYLPAYFLLQLVRFLEGKSEDQIYSVGLFYCFGLLGSFLLEAVIA